jgi:5-hydroxyisourate hydrolase-like protein (transthyretin family)
MRGEILVSRRVAGFLLTVIFITIVVFGTTVAADKAFAENTQKNPGRLFSDVTADNANGLYIRYAVERGIFQGFPDGSFKPGEGLTRAQAAVVIVKAAGLKTNDGDSLFTDVSPDYWAAPYIKAAANAGYIKGFPDGSYRPDAVLTRAQGIALLMQMCTHNDRAELPVLEDMNQNHWAAEPMAVALAAEMIGLSADGKNVYPDADFSRGSLARALVVLLIGDSGLYETKLIGTVSDLKGQVEVQRPGKTVSLKEGALLYEGDCVITGDNSNVTINYPDGSSSLIREKSEAVIKSAIGRSYMKKDGSTGIAIEFLNIELKRGTLFNALASKKGNPEAGTNQQAINSVEKSLRLAALDQFKFAARDKEKSQPWYKTAERKKVKVKVDMPWGVASVRGTFIKVTVNQDGTCSVSCLTGSTEVSGGSGGTVTVGQGQGSSITGQGQAAGQAGPMSQADQQEFGQVQNWVVDTALQMDINQEAQLTPPTMEFVMDVDLSTPEQVETALQTVVNALQSRGIELRNEVIQNLKEQISQIQSQDLQGQLGTVAGQLGQGSQQSSSSNRSSSSSGGRSSDSLLQSLSISHGDLSPAFNSNVFSYTLLLNEQIKSIIITPVTRHGSATLQVQGGNVSSGSPVSLNLDNINTITINVKAQDGSPSTYNIAIIKQAQMVEVSGKVSDTDLEPLNGVSIKVLQSDELKAETSTAADGKFNLQLPVGDGYVLEASLTDYRTETMTFTVTAPGPIYLEAIRLQLAENEEQVQVNVVGQVSDIQGSSLNGVSIRVLQGDELKAETSTAANGEFTLQLPVGEDYVLEASLTDYRTETMTFTVTAPGPIYLEAIRLQLATTDETGSISGCISDAATGNPVPEVTVYIRQGLGSNSGLILNTTSTNQDGVYSFENLVPGGYTIELSAEGYTTAYYTVVVIGGELNANQNGTITRVLQEGETRIVLTWGETPRDLDSHLYGPTSDGYRFEVYYGNKQYYEDDKIAVKLDVDDTSGYGPETTTIYNQIDGVYSFLVHNFSNDRSLGHSVAQVKVYSGEKLAAVFNVPGNRDGHYWEVFAIEGNNIHQVNRVFDWIYPDTSLPIYYNNPEQADLRMDLGDNSLLSISNGSNLLEPGTDYVIDGYNSVYVTWHYLKSLPVGECQLVFAYEGGITEAVNLQIKERLAQVAQPWWGEGNSTVVNWEPVENVVGYRITLYIMWNDYLEYIDEIDVLDPSSCQYDVKEYLTEIVNWYNGEEYAVAVYATGDGPYLDGLLSPLSEAKRFVAVPGVASMEAVDVNDNGDASDIQVSFEPPEDQSGIAEYRIILVKSESSIGIGQILNLTSERYAVIEVGEEMPVTLPAALLDVDGEAISSGKLYYVCLVVVADDEQAQISRVCRSYAWIYLSIEETSPEIP